MHSSEPGPAAHIRSSVRLRMFRRGLQPVRRLHLPHQNTPHYANGLRPTDSVPWGAVRVGQCDERSRLATRTGGYGIDTTDREADADRQCRSRRGGE
jgi:hypothetical protein